MKKVCFSIILLIVAFSVQAQSLAFPDAEGYGKYTTGGRDSSRRWPRPDR